MHRQSVRPPGKQIRSRPPQLARARAGEHEAKPAPLDQTVDFVEQRRKLLHLVNDDDTGPLRVRHRLQSIGVSQEFGEGRLLEQVDSERVGENRTDPRRLPGAVGSEEEKGTITSSH